MIQIDIPMPKSCEECPFCEDSNCSIMPGVPAWINVSKYTDTRSEHCILINDKDSTEEGQTMPNRDKVIKGLEICTKDIPNKVISALHCRAMDLMIDRPSCSDCDYQIQRDNNCFVCDFQRIYRDAIKLLKEQEAVEPSSYHHLFICPGCKTTLKREQKFCHECGKCIRWEGR